MHLERVEFGEKAWNFQIRLNTCACFVFCMLLLSLSPLFCNNHLACWLMFQQSGEDCCHFVLSLFSVFFFQFLPLNPDLLETWKCKLYCFFFSSPFNVLLVYLQGDLDQFLEAYSWCVKVFTGGLKTKKIRATKYSEKETHFPKPANPLMCELVCGCRHGGLPLGGGGLLPGTVTWSLPLMWSPAITCHRTFWGGGGVSGGVGVFSLLYQHRTAASCPNKL